MKKIILTKKIFPYFHSLGLISVPAGRFPGGARWAASLALLAPGSHLWRWSPRSRPASTPINLYYWHTF